MTKEQFLQARTVNHFSDADIYEFYMEKCKGNCLDWPNFNSIINNPVHHLQPFGLSLVMFRKEIAFQKMIEYYNAKFGV